MTEDQYDIIQVRFMVTDRNGFLNRVREIADRHDVSVICLNEKVMAGKNHVKTALRGALRAVSRGEQISRSIEMEVLLYAAGTRQTSLVGPFGIQDGENRCYLCIVPRCEEAIGDLMDLMTVDTGDWEEISPEKKRVLMEFFDITPAELTITGDSRIAELVCERSALLAVNR